MVKPQATVKVVWQALVGVLQEAQLETPVADARLLIQHALKMRHEDLLMNGDRVVTTQEQTEIETVMKRRLQREPVARIIGLRAFWKADFKVTPETLDPRQDSETLIEAALHHVDMKTPPEGILDLGTGTGCLLLSLLMEYPQAQGIGLDISAGAVRTAGENARCLGLSRRATFIALDWNTFHGGPFDLIVSNPPYIAETEKPDLAPEVVLYDPPAALFGGTDGLDAYRSLAQIVPPMLSQGGYALFEIGYMQASAVKSLLADAGLDVIETRTDLSGKDRVIVTRKC